MTAVNGFQPLTMVTKSFILQISPSSLSSPSYRGPTLGSHLAGKY